MDSPLRNTTSKGAVLAGLCAVMLTGCSSMISHNQGATDSSGNGVSTLIPNQTLQVTRTLALSAENIALGAIIYWAVDPLAPNWELGQTYLGGDQVRIALRKKRFSTGGDGEASQLFSRRATQLARQGGYSGFTVMEYTEGIESTLPVAQRVSQGVIRLDR